MKEDPPPNCCVIISGIMADFEGIPAIGNSYSDDDDDDGGDGELEESVPL